MSEHNRAPVTKGHGSCIFIHVVTGTSVKLTGCTGLAKSAILTLTRWLEPHAALLVALPESAYRNLRGTWYLP